MSYNNRMESMVTPRAGVRIETEDGVLWRGVSVPRDHPAYLANRAAFIVADAQCVPLVEPKAKAKKAKPVTEEAGE